LYLGPRIIVELAAVYIKLPCHQKPALLISHIIGLSIRAVTTLLAEPYLILPTRKKYDVEGALKKMEKGYGILNRIRLRVPSSLSLLDSFSSSCGHGCYW
jgi:hypothetical protein